MRPLRLALTVLVTLVAGGGLAVAQDALQAEPAPPEIVTDLEGPLFLLEQMAPGVPLERCVTVYPRGATAPAVALSGDVRGTLTHLVHQEVTAGSATDGVRATRDCRGFTPEAELWQGTLDEFPDAGAPIEDTTSLAPGRPRVYRFRVWVDGDAVVRLDELAEQDLTWAARLDPVVPPTTATPETVTVTTPAATQTTTTPGTTQTVTTPAVTQTTTTPGATQTVTTPAVTQTVTTPAATQTVTTPAMTQVVTTPGQPGRTVTAPPVPPVAVTPSAPLPPECVAQPAARPRATVVIDGRRATFMVGPARRLRQGEPLVLRVRDPRGVVGRVTYAVDGRRLPSAAGRPWRAALPVAVLAAGGSRVVARIQTSDGTVRYRRADLRTAGCPSIVRATAPAASPDRLTVSLDPGRALRGATVVLPSGVSSADTAVRTASGLRVAAMPRNRRLALGAMPAGARVELTTIVDGAHRRALAVARCTRATVKLRLDPVSGPSQWVLVPLQGRGGGCPR